VKKGDQVYVEGAIRTRKWEKDGVTRYSTEVVINDFNGEVRKLGSSGDGGSKRDEGSYGTTRDREPRSGASGGGTSGAGTGGMDDEIPFAPEVR
jgi:single-strand DNA-binding protein